MKLSKKELYNEFNRDDHYSLIIDKKLTDIEVIYIVKEWYLNLTSEILQTEEGDDLEEYLDMIEEAIPMDSE